MNGCSEQMEMNSPMWKAEIEAISQYHRKIYGGYVQTMNVLRTAVIPALIAHASFSRDLHLFFCSNNVCFVCSDTLCSTGLFCSVNLPKAFPVLVNHFNFFFFLGEVCSVLQPTLSQAEYREQKNSTKSPRRTGTESVGRLI